jgi:hypothetical protein
MDIDSIIRRQLDSFRRYRFKCRDRRSRERARVVCPVAARRIHCKSQLTCHEPRVSTT